MTATLQETDGAEARSRAATPPSADAVLDAARRLLASRLVRFLCVGAAGLATDTLVFGLSSRTGATDAGARAVSLAVATFVTWLGNRRFTFAASGRRSGPEAARYAAVALGAQGFNWALFCLIRGAFPESSPFGAIFFSAAAAAAFSFIGQRTITFAPAIRSAP